jgi:hypothetical protein
MEKISFKTKEEVENVLQEQKTILWRVSNFQKCLMPNRDECLHHFTLGCIAACEDILNNIGCYEVYARRDVCLRELQRILGSENGLVQRLNISVEALRRAELLKGTLIVYTWYVGNVS